MNSLTSYQLPSRNALALQPTRQLNAFSDGAITQGHWMDFWPAVKAAYEGGREMLGVAPSERVINAFSRVQSPVLRPQNAFEWGDWGAGLAADTLQTGLAAADIAGLGRAIGPAAGRRFANAMMDQSGAVNLPGGGQQKSISLKGIDNKFFKMPRDEYDIGDWFITGLTGKRSKINETRPLWASKSETQGEYFADAGKGTIVYSKPKKGAKILDLTDEKQFDDFLEKIEDLTSQDHGSIAPAVRDVEQFEGLRKALHPEDIVEEGGIWDRNAFTSAVYEEFGYDFVKTHDGGIYLNPESAWITKKKPLNAKFEFDYLSGESFAPNYKDQLLSERQGLINKIGAIKDDYDSMIEESNKITKSLKNWSK